MTELEAEDRLAAAILRGNIAIKETQTVMGSIVTHIGCIMTQIMLTIMIVLWSDKFGNYLPTRKDELKIITLNE